jgi:hypothetical protein
VCCWRVPAWVCCDNRGVGTAVADKGGPNSLQVQHCGGVVHSRACVYSRMADGQQASACVCVQQGCELIKDRPHQQQDLRSKAAGSA